MLIPYEFDAPSSLFSALHPFLQAAWRECQEKDGMTVAVASDDFGIRSMAIYGGFQLVKWGYPYLSLDDLLQGNSESGMDDD